MSVARIHDDKGRSIEGWLGTTEREQINERAGTICSRRSFMGQQVYYIQSFCRSFQAGGVRRQLVRPAIAGVPAARTPIEGAFNTQSQGDFAWTKDHLSANGRILRPFGCLDADRAGRQMRFANAIDVGVGVVPETDLPTDIFTGSPGEFHQPAERHSANSGRVDEAQTHWRRLTGCSIDYAHVNGEHVFSREFQTA
jgi:hypothetical protein